MRSASIHLLALVFFTIYSCAEGNRNVKEQEVSTLIVSSDDSCETVVNYFKNGIIESQGQLCKGEKHGHWKAFYADGTLKWEGVFSMGYRKVPNFDSLKLHCEFIFEDDDGFIISRARQFRVKVPPIGPGELIVHIKSGEINAPKDRDYFDHAITPDSLGDLCIEVIYRYRPDISICRQCFTVYPADAQ